MHVHLKKLRFKNFLSYGNTFTEIDLDTRNTTLIIGKNGAGKSTFLDALTFVLYNKPFRKINKPQLVNSLNKKHCLVECEFNIGSSEYFVRRGIKPAVFEIYKNGVLIDQEALSRDYQTHLENYVLKMNYKAFVQVYIVGSATFVPFMQLTTAHRREIIEDLLDIKIFSSMKDLLKDELTDSKKSHDSVTTEITLERALLEKDYEQHRAVTETITESVNDYEKKIRRGEKEIAECKAAIQTLEAEIEDQRKLVSDKAKVKKRLTKIVENLGKADARRAVAVREQTFYTDHNNCPTCKQEITNAAGMLAKQASVIGKIDEKVSEWTEERDSCKTRLSSIESLESELSSKRNKIAGYKTRTASIERDIQSAKAQIVALQNRQESASLEEPIAERQAKIRRLENDAEAQSKEINLLEATASLLKDDGIKSKIVKQYIPVLNKYINFYLKKFQFDVRFELDETFKETIKARNLEEFSYDSFSEGEKLRIDLALLFTWRQVARLRNSVSSNLLIMDEVLDGSMDDIGTADFLDIIKNLEGDQNIFVISHKADEMREHFESIIQFKKVNRYSQRV